MQKIKFYLKNPIVIFSILAVILSLVLAFCVHFEVPDFYIDREAAFNLAQTVAARNVRETISHLENIQYKIFNPVFQIWGWVISLLFLSVCFKISNFKNIKDIKIFHNKKFIYFWINLSYPIYSACLITMYMIHLERRVYSTAADSMGIPFFTMMFSLLFFALIYYPAANLLFYLVYNTKIKRKFYDLLFILCGLYTIYNIIYVCGMKFTYFHLFTDIYFAIWIMLIVDGLKELRRKRQISLSTKTNLTD